MSKTSRPTPGYPEGYAPEPKEASTEKKSVHKDKGPSKTAGERVENLKKNIAARREAPGAEELLEVAELTEEQLEAIRLSPFFQDFEEGMWAYYKDNVDDGKSETEQEDEFEEWCREHARENLEYLLKKGELENFKEYLENQENSPGVEEPELTVEKSKEIFLKALDEELSLLEKEGRITPEQAEEKRKIARLIEDGFFGDLEQDARVFAHSRIDDQEATAENLKNENTAGGKNAIH